MDTFSASRYTTNMSIHSSLPPVHERSDSLESEAWTIWNQKVKPQLSLGMLERIAVDIVMMTGQLHPQLGRPQMLVFAADHGIVAEGVSSSPQEITWQQCENFARGHGAIGLLCDRNGIDLHIIDVGVCYTFPEESAVIPKKVAWGTQNFLYQSAMTEAQLQQALLAGREMVQVLVAQGHRVFAFGEMGIGNTTSSSALMVCRTSLDVQQCTGRGAGLDDTALVHKQQVITEALKRGGIPNDPIEALRQYGGFEIAALVGAMIEAAHQRCVLLIDGFITTVAAEIAQSVRPACQQYMLFCHESSESGHALLLQHMEAKALLSLRMHLGEGSGAAVAWSLIHNAVQLYNDMESFAEAEVTDSVSLLQRQGIDARTWEHI